MLIQRWIAGACYFGLAVIVWRWEPKRRALKWFKWWAAIVTALMLWAFLIDG